VPGLPGTRVDGDRRPGSVQHIRATARPEDGHADLRNSAGRTLALGRLDHRHRAVYAYRHPGLYRLPERALATAVEGQVVLLRELVRWWRAEPRHHRAERANDLHRDLRPRVSALTDAAYA